MYEDTERCLRAVRSKDARFDGWFFTAVTSTGIYCRPSCPAVPPKQERLRFYPTAAAAQQAGFRACKRCRPDATPGSPEWNERADLVARAMRLIADGVVDREGVPGLAARLGYSARQVQRQLRAEVGAGPLAIARAQRAQTARILIETTATPITDIAFAAGFSSVRMFNDTIREVFALSPSELRERARPRGRRGSAGQPVGSTLRLRLPFRRPLCPDNLFGHVVATAVPGVEEWRDGRYRRTLRLPHGHGIAELTPPAPGAAHVECRLALSDLRDLGAATQRCRWLLDLDADPVAIDEQLGTDPAFAEAVRAAPGRRVPRTVDGAEFALRAMIGQQVSTAAARTHAARLVLACGDPVDDAKGGLTHLFPAPEALAGVEPDRLAFPQRRRDAIRTMAYALASESLDLGPGADWPGTRESLAALPGVGPWTVEVIAMRALGDPDAFPATDLGVHKALQALGVATSAVRSRTERWRPWRAYAVQHLWAMGRHAVNQLPAADQVA